MIDKGRYLWYNGYSKGKEIDSMAFYDVNVEFDPAMFDVEADSEEEALDIAYARAFDWVTIAELTVSKQEE